ncbi:MAG: hypothetical protein DMF43_00560 [Verrucomicrobia bacterium]|nr:MAG: hypothetical protein DMF43_00560 [Verrucomicrobiota bacterium]
MAHEPAESTIRFAPARRSSFAQRASDYFAMSGPAEFVAAAGFLVLMVAVKIVNMTRYRFDSDESQHMHVIWAWARGFVQYRDVFDNHMPLFQILFAPIFGVIGDRATILYWMRFILLPMYFVGAWCTYRIGESVFSRRAGIWAVILTGFYTKYHFSSFEFRTDNLWAPLWLLCVTVLISGALMVPRAVVAGLLLGFCFGISMKSALSVAGIAAGRCSRCARPDRKKKTWPIVVASGALRCGISWRGHAGARHDRTGLHLGGGVARFYLLQLRTQYLAASQRQKSSGLVDHYFSGGFPFRDLCGLVNRSRGSWAGCGVSAGLCLRYLRFLSAGSAQLLEPDHASRLPSLLSPRIRHVQWRSACTFAPRRGARPAYRPVSAALSFAGVYRFNRSCFSAGHASVLDRWRPN